MHLHRPLGLEAATTVLATHLGAAHESIQALDAFVQVIRYDRPVACASHITEPDALLRGDLSGTLRRLQLNR